VHLFDSKIEGLAVIGGDPRHDWRGSLTRIYDQAEYRKLVGVDIVWQQQSWLRSRHRVLRGLHFRTDLDEWKQICPVHGEIYSAIIDLRPWSSTYGKWESFILGERSGLQILIPPGCAHGFQALSAEVNFVLSVTTPYDPAKDAGIIWNDPRLAIDWPYPDPLLSVRDRELPSFDAVESSLASAFGRQ
jgi:dTDP-4-dehydrorhamnose 3,5-epimerase